MMTGRKEKSRHTIHLRDAPPSSELEAGFQPNPPRADALRDDFPSAPKITGSLVLQQVNLWVCRSENGAPSGLVCECGRSTLSLSVG